VVRNLARSTQLPARHGLHDVSSSNRLRRCFCRLTIGTQQV
jgi:hypothetical protein